MRLLLALAVAVAVSQGVPLLSERIARSADAERGHDVVVLVVDLDNPAERAWPTHLRVRLRPDLSGPSSAAFVRAAAVAGCGGRVDRDATRVGFEFARGEIDCAAVLTATDAHREAARLQLRVAKGPCPAGAASDLGLEPNRERDRGCYGPVVTRGMVGWAAAGSGPEFFVYTGERPAEHWAREHTVWGEVADDATFAALARLHALPGKEIRSEFQGGGGGVRMLDAPLLMRVTEASDPEPAAESPAGGAL